MDWWRDYASAWREAALSYECRHHCRSRHAEVRLVKSREARHRLLRADSRGGKVLGQVGIVGGVSWRREIHSCSPGEILRYEGLAGDEIYVSRASGQDPKIPTYEGGKFPLSTYLAERVRQLLAEPARWRVLPDEVREWLDIQQWRSIVPGARDLLVETFPRGDKNYLVCYPFEGRLAHQTLGMLLTRRLERARMRPLGFVANEYALAVWGLGDPALAIRQGELSLHALFDEDMLGDQLEAWLDKSALMKRTFHNCAIIAGLIERRFPGEEKSRRQMTISTDLVYDVLRRHQAEPRAAAGCAPGRRDRGARYPPAWCHALAHPWANRA